MTVTLTGGAADDYAAPVQPQTDSTNGGGADPPPLAVAMPWDDDAWALVLPPGTDLPSLANAVRRLPAGCQFVEAHGDVETVLVFRFAEPQGADSVPAGARTAGDDAELRPPAHAHPLARWPCLAVEPAPNYHRIVADLTAEVEKGLRAIAALGYTLDGGMVP